MEKNTGPWTEFQSSAPAADSGPWDEFKAKPEKPRTRGLLEAVNDNVIEFANAAAGGVSALANFAKPGNAVSSFIDENIIKSGEAKQSDVVRAEKQALGQSLQNAQGIGDEVGAVGNYVLSNPLLAASQAAGSFALPGGLVKGAGKAAQVLGAGVKGIETAGRVGGIAAGAAMAGGDAAGTAYDLSSQAGATDEQATEAGRQASVIPALVGGVTGAFGAERLLAGAKGFGGNALSRGVKSGLSEAGQEAVEEGVTQYEGQRAAMPYDASIDPTKGVAGAAAMGGIMGFGPGAVLGAMGGGPELPSKQMGIDPSAGPLSRAAASAVDSAPTPQLGFSPLAGTPTIYPDGSVTLNGEQDFQKRNPGVQQGMDLSKIAQPSQPLAAERKPAQPESVPMEGRSLEELRQAFRGAQDPAIRKTLAAEIRKRREAMPDPLSQPQQEIALEPQATEPVQTGAQEPQAQTNAKGVALTKEEQVGASGREVGASGRPAFEPGIKPQSRFAGMSPEQITQATSDRFAQNQVAWSVDDSSDQTIRRGSNVTFTKDGKRVPGVFGGVGMGGAIVINGDKTSFVDPDDVQKDLSDGPKERPSSPHLVLPYVSDVGEFMDAGPAKEAAKKQVLDAINQGKTPKEIGLTFAADDGEIVGVLNSVGGTDEKLPAGSFMDPSLPVNTGVNARMVVIDKPASTENQAPTDTTETNDEANFGTKDRGQGTPADRAVMAMASEGRSADDILRFIANASKSPYRRQLAKKLIATGANPAVSLGGEMGGGAGFRFLAKYSRKDHEVTLSEAAADRAEQIFLHETVHAATLLALDKGGLIATQMNRLYEHAKKQSKGEYGFKNVGEFVAEAFTNPEFQKSLKGMKADNRSLWDRIVNIVRRILGLPDTQQDALSKALELGVEVMRENIPLRAAKSFRAEDGPAFAGSMNSMPENKAPGPQGDAQQGAKKGDAVASSKQIVDAIMQDEDDGWSEYALRTIPADFKGDIRPGDILPPSNQWDDGFDTGEPLYGTSAIGIREYDEKGVLDALGTLGADGKSLNYFGDTVVLIKSPDVQNGEDFGESLLKDAKVVAVWKKEGKGKAALIPNDQSAPVSGGASDSYMGIDQTETPEFKRWFGDSKVVDDAGKPLVVYHGTGSAIKEFRPTDGGSLGEGIYFTEDADAASRFAERKGGSMNVMPVYISASRILDADHITDEQRKAIDAAIPKNADELVSFGFPRSLAEESKDFIDRDLKKILGAKRFDPKSLSLAVQGGPATVIEAIYKKAGFDAITRISDGLIGRDAFREYLVFRPEQIKSATGNKGNFDPNDPDIAHFGMADAVEQIKAFDVKQAPKNTWAHYRGMAMQALGRRQIVDLYSEELPQLKQYDYLVQQMDAEKNESGAEADQLAQDWGGLKDEKALAELMHDATLARIDPSKALPDGYSKAEYDRLKARYSALSPEAKKLFTQARDMYKDHYRAVQQAIKDRIERSEMSPSQKKQMMASLDEKLFKELEGVYFPLARFGQYVIVVKDANGEVKNVTRAETVSEAEESRKELMKAFPKHMGYTVGKVLKQAEFNAGRDAVGKGFMADLMGALDAKGVDDELRDTVAQLYLSSLPDLSWAKHGIHRKGTPGFSQDARRAFAQNMFHGARYLAKLRYSDQLQDELSAMQDHIKAYEGVEEYDSVEAQQVVDEMVKRHEWLMNPKASPVSTALTSFGFLFHMGLSPASAMVNLTQTALVAFPQMGAKWGFSKAGAALTKASEEVVRAKNDLSRSLKGAELDAFERAVKDGTIDVTMAHDLAGIAQGEDQGVMWKIRPVMRWASFMFHHAEKFNRQATFIAAFRLSKEASPEKPADWHYEAAKKATYDGHFDYSAANRARMMQGNWQRVILLFKQYAQSMVYTLARNAYQSVKALDPKERTQARKTLGGILAAHAAAAGVLGLPLVGPLLTVASWIGGDDDEPWDAEIAMQNAMAEMLGPKAAEVISRGFSRLTPFDLSGRVALNKLILPDVQEGLEGKEWAESAMAAALGPVAGIGVNVARGVQKMTEGDYMRGLEDMMPTALRGPIKALRYGSEGAIDKTGVVITDEVSTAGIVGQASGFSPSEVRRDTERRSAIYAYDRALLERRSVLMRMAAEARIQGDDETFQEVQADIQAFNQKHPNRRITPMNIAASVRNRRKRVEEAQQGVYLPKKRQDALDAVAF